MDTTEQFPQIGTKRAATPIADAVNPPDGQPSWYDTYVAKAEKLGQRDVANGIRILVERLGVGSPEQWHSVERIEDMVRSKLSGRDERQALVALRFIDADYRRAIEQSRSVKTHSEAVPVRDIA